MLKTSSSKIAKILILLITQLYFTESFADDSSINNDIVKEIEKTLLFDKYSREKINIYKASKLKKKSDYTIGQDFEEKKISTSDAQWPNRLVGHTIRDGRGVVDDFSLFANE